MKLHYLLRLLAITAFITSTSLGKVSAQQQPILCGSDIMTQKMLAEHPELWQKYAESEAHTQIYVRTLEAQKAAKAHGPHQATSSAPTIYIIPIVFHILEENGPENISDAQIMSEMKILNEDWGHTNSDTNDAVTAHFKAIEGNMQVQFRLATIDPHGKLHQWNRPDLHPPYQSGRGQR